MNAPTPETLATAARLLRAGGVAVLPSDTALGRKFTVTLAAEITVTDASGRKLVDRRTVRVARDVFTDSGQQPAEYQTLPLLAEALATEIAHAVLDTW